VTVKTFTPTQLAYVQAERRLGRLATADEKGKPHVTPVGMWRYNPELGTVDISGHNLAATKKYRNVQANPQAALVIDDLATTDPWHPRAVIVEGSAEAVPGDGDDALIRITPNKIISWGLEPLERRHSQ
jgi:pyridoxamine 5'-phosphate oxidase family protein